MTAADVIAQARTRYSEMSPTGLGLDLFNVVHNRILTKVQCQVDVEDLTALVAGTKEYDLAATVRKVWSANYYNSASDGDVVKLVARPVEAFEQVKPDYVQQTSDQPDHYYVTYKSDGTLKVGFDPTPDTTTSSGYPFARLRVSRGATLATSGVLPVGVNDYSAWVSGLMAEYARLKRSPEEAVAMKQLFTTDLAELQAEVHGQMEESPSVVVPYGSWSRRKRV